MTERVFERDGEVWSEEAGAPDAPLLALVHGSLDRSAGLLKLSRRLDDRCRVLRYDRRGYGRSTPHDGPFGIDEQVADLVALLDGRPAVVFGHSYGGNVALALADRHPEAGPGRRRLRGAAAVARLVAGRRPPAARRAASDGRPGRRRRALHAPDGRRREVGAAARRRPARRGATEGVTMVGELADLRERAPWDPARHPRAGRGDARLGRQRAPPPVDVPPRAVLADCPVVTIEGARHFGPNTHPDAVAAVSPTWSPERRATVTSRPKNVHVVSSVAPAASVSADLVGAVLQRLALPPHDGGDADEDATVSSLPTTHLTTTANTTASTTAPTTIASATSRTVVRSIAEHGRADRTARHAASLGPRHRAAPRMTDGRVT